MASVNKAIIVGRLGRDPEVRYSAEGAAVCNISVATESAWKDKNTGERKSETEWHRVVFYNRLAEIAGEYLRKGREVYIEGRLKTRKWQGQDGQDRYTTEIVADQMQMLGGRDGGGDDPQGSGQAQQQRPNQQQRQQRPAAPASPPSAGSLADMDDDIPFRQLGAGRAYLCI